MKTSTESDVSTTVAATVAGEDIHFGDYVTCSSATCEVPSYMWDQAMLPAAELVRLKVIPSDAGVPLKVFAVCLPFVYAKDSPQLGGARAHAGVASNSEKRARQMAATVPSHPDEYPCCLQSVAQFLRARHRAPPLPSGREDFGSPCRSSSDACPASLQFQTALILARAGRSPGAGGKEKPRRPRHPALNQPHRGQTGGSAADAGFDQPSRLVRPIQRSPPRPQPV